MTSVRAQRLSTAAAHGQVPVEAMRPIVRDPDLVDLNTGDVRKIPRAAIPMSNPETRGVAPPARPRPPAAAKASTAQTQMDELLDLDTAIIAFAAASPDPLGPSSMAIAEHVQREPAQALTILKKLAAAGLLIRHGKTRSRWSFPADRAKPVCPAAASPQREPSSAAPQASPVTPKPPTDRPSLPGGLTAGPLPPKRGSLAGLHNKGPWRKLAERIAKHDQHFIWPKATRNDAAQVRRWAKAGLPIDRYFDTAGRLIVCHKDAEIPK